MGNRRVRHVAPLYRDPDGFLIEVQRFLDPSAGIDPDARYNGNGARREGTSAVAYYDDPLGELVKICASCKRIGELPTRWVPLERFLAERTDASFSHGLCPDCLRDVGRDER